jgi:hypothetical protein
MLLIFQHRAALVKPPSPPPSNLPIVAGIEASGLGTATPVQEELCQCLLGDTTA